MQELIEHVRAIANDINDGIKTNSTPGCKACENAEVISLIRWPHCDCDGSEMLSGFDYLNDALDIQYIVTGEGEYIGARVLVAFGGPNIWVNTHTGIVEGYWGSNSATANFLNDPMDVDGACRELWECK
tara:strand:+ start:99 stop:485 length:387 start_codon:yes stop_codon:yes gene_type:complete